jgi:hypothetical protein
VRQVEVKDPNAPLTAREKALLRAQKRGGAQLKLAQHIAQCDYSQLGARAPPRLDCRAHCSCPPWWDMGRGTWNVPMGEKKIGTLLNAVRHRRRAGGQRGGGLRSPGRVCHSVTIRIQTRSKIHTITGAIKRVWISVFT